MAAAAELGVESCRAPPSEPPPLRLPAVLSPFPWDLARAELGFAGTDLLALLAHLLARVASETKDQRMKETPLLMQGYASTGRDP